MTLRIIFMGTPDFAVPALTELVGAGYEVAAVYTRAPRAAGRGMKAQPSPVQRVVEGFGIPVRTPASLRDPVEQAAFAALGADLAVVIAYGLILPQAVLDAPRLYCLNLHASLLPRWRGAAPIQRAIMAGDAETGVAVMRMEAGLDTGPVGMVEKTSIGPDETAAELADRLARLGGDLMLRAVGAAERGALDFVPQPEAGVVYAAKIDKAEARIDWTRPATDVHNHIRGLSPFPGAWCEAEIGGKAERVKLLRSTRAEGGGAPGTILDDALTIACGTGAVRIVSLQRAGRQAMAPGEFLRGAKLAPGDRLG